jgi:hypothetical protein
VRHGVGRSQLLASLPAAADTNVRESCDFFQFGPSAAHRGKKILPACRSAGSPFVLGTKAEDRTMNSPTVSGDEWRAARKALLDELTRLRDQFSRGENVQRSEKR